MADWNDLLNYVYSKYKVDNQQDGLLGVTFRLDDGRTQFVSLARYVNAQNEEWVHIESGIGMLGRVDLVDALRQVNDLICGGLSISGEYITLRHAVPLADLSVEEFERPLHAVISSADRMEQRWNRADML